MISVVYFIGVIVGFISSLAIHKCKRFGEKYMTDKINKIDQKEWQGLCCIECVYSPNCAGAGVMKNACRGFEPAVQKE